MELAFTDAPEIRLDAAGLPTGAGADVPKYERPATSRTAVSASRRTMANLGFIVRALK
jgi:hypothetical protein